MEKKVPATQIIRDRIKRLGIYKVIGQLLFIIFNKIIFIVSQPKVHQLIKHYKLNDKNIPDNTNWKLELKKSIFEETLEFLSRNKITSAGFHPLTPFPGTMIYEKLKKEGRIFCCDWKYYDFHQFVFKPKNMTPEDLQEGLFRVRSEFYSISSILERLLNNLFIFRTSTLMNIAQKINEIKNAERIKKETSTLLSKYK